MTITINPKDTIALYLEFLRVERRLDKWTIARIASTVQDYHRFLVVEGHITLPAAPTAVREETEIPVVPLRAANASSSSSS